MACEFYDSDVRFKFQWLTALREERYNVEIILVYCNILLFYIQLQCCIVKVTKFTLSESVAFYLRY